LILDADEWLDAASAERDILGLERDPYIGLLPVGSQFDLSDQVEISVSWLPRLLPRGVRYEGRIHEQPVSKLPRLRVPVFVNHDGYRAAQMAGKRGRNEALLVEVLKDDPHNAGLLYQLGCEYQVSDAFEKSLHYLLEAYKHGKPDDVFRHALVVRALFSFKKTGRHSEGIQFADAEFANWQHSPDFFFALGDLMLEWAGLNPDTAREELIPIVEASWLKCLELGDQPYLEGSVKGRGSHLAALNLAIVYAGMGDEEKSRQYAELGKKLRQKKS
ncbi:MAG: glycosyltransferase family 2 protein, partial [Candidatus Protistobacter heckmanni]|nr:glycosyltransferase family 2 protein [Candidatus Protistobacter heckmanni]